MARVAQPLLSNQCYDRRVFLSLYELKVLKLINFYEISIVKSSTEEFNGKNFW